MKRLIKNKKNKIKITVATKYSHSIEKLRKKIWLRWNNWEVCFFFCKDENKKVKEKDERLKGNEKVQMDWKIIS